MFILHVDAQDDKTEKDYGTISTDRPNQTEASNLVPKNFLQVETGAFQEVQESQKKQDLFLSAGISFRIPG